MNRFLFAIVGLTILGSANLASAQVCPSGSTCLPLETYIYGQGAATPPLAGSLRIPIMPSATANTAQYVAANLLMDLSSSQTATNKNFTSPTITGAPLFTLSAGSCSTGVAL